MDPEAREFYEEAAAAAAALAVCIDVFVVSAVGCGLSAIEPLAAATGGAMFLYPNLEQAALPQVGPPPTLPLLQKNTPTLACTHCSNCSRRALCAVSVLG